MIINGDISKMSEPELVASIAEVDRRFRKYDRAYGRCNYFSKRGLEYADALRLTKKEKERLVAELASRSRCVDGGPKP